MAGALQARKRRAEFGGGIATLYAVLYGVLLWEDSALLMGTALLFLTLGVIMLATRKINWYKIGLSTRDELSS
jgi:inner membrane protein